VTDLHPSIVEKLQFFEHNHLSEPLFSVARTMSDAAHEMASTIKSHPQLSLGLQHLIEAKDCFVRAKVSEENERQTAANTVTPVTTESK
jgi:hypothetical protein